MPPENVPREIIIVKQKEEEKMATNTGKIKFFNNQKGFGFIICDDGAPEVFLHVSNWTPEGTYPKEGQKVQFDVQIDKRKGKPTAANVRAG